MGTDMLNELINKLKDTIQDFLACCH